VYPKTFFSQCCAILAPSFVSLLHCTQLIMCLCHLTVCLSISPKRSSKLKTSAKRQRNAKANILLEDLFGQLSMDSDSDGKYPHTVPPTQQAKSGKTSTGGHRERERDRERDLFGESFLPRPGLRKKATQSSLEVNNGSHADSL